MGTLVIQVHPLEESYNAALLEAVTGALVDRSVEFRTVRLCQGDHLDVAELADVEHLVAVYPTWWGGLPAPLLDWFQAGVGPVVDGTSGDQASPLRTVRRISVVTSHGSSRLMNWTQGRSGFQTWKRVLLPLCAPDADFDWISLYKIDRTTEPERRRFVQEVGRRITSASASVGSSA